MLVQFGETVSHHRRTGNAPYWLIADSHYLFLLTAAMRARAELYRRAKVPTRGQGPLIRPIFLTPARRRQGNQGADVGAFLGVKTFDRRYNRHGRAEGSRRERPGACAARGAIRRRVGGLGTSEVRAAIGPYDHSASSLAVANTWARRGAPLAASTPCPAHKPMGDAPVWCASLYAAIPREKAAANSVPKPQRVRWIRLMSLAMFLKAARSCASSCTL